jgi:hypothetical protein
MPKMKWTVEFEVDTSWVADGFNLDDERAMDMLKNDLRFAISDELGAKVISSPPAARIAKLQGYDPLEPETWPIDLRPKKQAGDGGRAA